MGSDPNASGLKSLTTDELNGLWAEACKSLAANRDAETYADVEPELDSRNESLPFHLVRNELAILGSGHRGSRVLPRDS
jgi:hypothetical protein